MRKRNVAFILVVLLASWTPVSGGGVRDPAATVLTMPEPQFQRPAVEILESQPVQFVLAFELQMPTPGWTSVVDAVEVDGDRITVKITQKAPQGIVAQVITPTRLRVPLGSLGRGRYVLELRTRRDETADYGIAHALVLVAS